MNPPASGKRACLSTQAAQQGREEQSGTGANAAPCVGEQMYTMPFSASTDDAQNFTVPTTKRLTQANNLGDDALCLGTRCRRTNA